MGSSRSAVDLRTAADLDVAVRIGSAWREMRRGASAAVLRDYLFGTAADALDAGQMDTLDVLIQQPAWRMSELAEALRVDPSTATRSVQRLVKVNLAGRHADIDDGRVVIVCATDAGRRLHKSIDVRRGEVISKLMSAFTPPERTDLADLLTRFVQRLDQVVDDLPRAAG
ncbi:MAG: MarR family transcriptional regulator [Actinobacteria bacterium]|nr:MarR family transcriptional regulator [Actinomycetota bacterium]